MKKFSFDDVQGVWSSHFKEANFGVTPFDYGCLSSEVYMRGITKQGKPVYLVLWTVPDEYLSDAILVLSKDEYEREYKYRKDRPDEYEYYTDYDGGNPDIPESEYLPIDEERLKGIIQCCEQVDWEEFKRAAIM